MNITNFEQAVAEKLRLLSPDKQQEVLDFAEFLCQKFATVDRRTFLQLTLEERRHILTTQSQKMIAHYEQDTEWKEWAEVGVGNIYEFCIR